ncbi:MAG: hypothetical protein PVF49_10145 [Anaerolineales bacterium]|jgi:hypothetical protein
MTSLRELIAWFIERDEPKPDLPDPGFDYRVYWTKQAIGWSPDLRKRVQQQVSALRSQPGFKPDRTEKMYTLEALGDERFAGASIVELEIVLRAMQEVDS